MKLNSKEGVQALTEVERISQIRLVEKKIHRLSFIPAALCGILMIYAFWIIGSEHHSWSPLNILLLASAIFGVGQSNIQRADLLTQLFELRYGK